MLKVYFWFQFLNQNFNNIYVTKYLEENKEPKQAKKKKKTSINQLRGNTKMMLLWS